MRLRQGIRLGLMVWWLGVFSWQALAIAQTGAVRILIQESPLAGSQFHALNSQWELITVGAELGLIREPENRHDTHAIRVEWQGHLLGYLPRRENRVVAAAMDAGDTLVAKVIAIQAHRNPWLRVRFAVYSVL